MGVERLESHQESLDEIVWVHHKDSRDLNYWDAKYRDLYMTVVRTFNDYTWRVLEPGARTVVADHSGTVRLGKNKCDQAKACAEAVARIVAA